MSKVWATVRVRAYNLRPGDVISFYDLRRHREVTRTVKEVAAEGETGPAQYVVIRYRRCQWGQVAKRGRVVRVRRLVEVKP